MANSCNWAAALRATALRGAADGRRASLPAALPTRCSPRTAPSPGVVGLFLEGRLHETRFLRRPMAGILLTCFRSTARPAPPGSLFFNRTPEEVLFFDQNF